MFNLTLLLMIVVNLVYVKYALGRHKILNLPEGAKCVYDKYNGTCVKDYKCLSMIKSIKEKTVPPICSYGKDSPIICCTDCQIEGTHDIRNLTYIRWSGLLFKNGQKAHDKCIEYLKDYPYECREHNTVTYDFKWYEPYKCTAFIINGVAPVGGIEAERGEFPHMALLGYGSEEKSLEWLCGGSLISDKFVLTAGHCIASVDFGPVTYIAVGILKRSDPPELWRMYKVKKIIPHPDYHSPSKYNDIALLETEMPVKIDTLVIPACLQTNDYYSINRPTATGWGNLGTRKPLADTLQKVELQKFTDEECGNIYQSHRHLQQGYDNETQMCYGDREEAKDTCTGDSGGPLHDFFHDCQFRIIGVTSAGLPCGNPGGAGLYTRVQHYIPWIESIVWP